MLTGISNNADAGGPAVDHSLSNTALGSDNGQLIFCPQARAPLCSSHVSVSSRPLDVSLRTTRGPLPHYIPNLYILLTFLLGFPSPGWLHCPPCPKPWKVGLCLGPGWSLPSPHETSSILVSSTTKHRLSLRTHILSSQHGLGHLDVPGPSHSLLAPSPSSLPQGGPLSTTHPGQALGTALNPARTPPAFFTQHTSL